MISSNLCHNMDATAMATNCDCWVLHHQCGESGMYIRLRLCISCLLCNAEVFACFVMLLLVFFFSHWGCRNHSPHSKLLTGLFCCACVHACLCACMHVCVCAGACLLNVIVFKFGCCCAVVICNIVEVRDRNRLRGLNPESVFLF